MKTKERNLGEEKSTTNKELLNREVLSDEALKEVGGAGNFEDPEPPRCNYCMGVTWNDPYCFDQCCKTREDCPRY